MLAVLIYVSAIAASNLSIAAFGPWVSPINAFVLIGLDLSLRDTLHDRWRGRWLWPRMMMLITIAGLLSYVVNPDAGRIALASLGSFVAAAVADAVVYQWLINRPFWQRANASNSAGAAVDSVLFPSMAFGAWLPAVIALQFAAKVVGGALWSVAFATLAARAAKEGAKTCPGA